jgi:hypothetical protein
MSIDNVDRRSSTGSLKRSCWLLVVEFKLVNDNVRLSMKEIYNGFVDLSLSASSF